MNGIDTSGIVLKIKYDTDKSDLEKKINEADKKIPNTNGLVKKTDYYAEIEGKIPTTSGLAISAALTAVENKIPNVSSLVKKTDHDAKTSDIESKYFTTADCNKFTSQTLDAKIKEKELVDKSAIAGFINNGNLNKKVATLATNAELKAEQNKIIKLQAFDSSHFCSTCHFEGNGTENYLEFQPMYR